MMYNYIYCTLVAYLLCYFSILCEKGPYRASNCGIWAFSLDYRKVHKSKWNLWLALAVGLHVFTYSRQICALLIHVYININTLDFTYEYATKH